MFNTSLQNPSEKTIPDWSTIISVGLPYTAIDDGMFGFTCRAGSSGGNIYVDGIQVFYGGGGAESVYRFWIPVKKGSVISHYGSQPGNWQFVKYG